MSSPRTSRPQCQPRPGKAIIHPLRQYHEQNPYSGRFIKSGHINPSQKQHIYPPSQPVLTQDLPGDINLVHRINLLIHFYNFTAETHFLNFHAIVLRHPKVVKKAQVSGFLNTSEYRISHAPVFPLAHHRSHNPSHAACSTSSTSHQHCDNLCNAPHQILQQL